MSALLTPSEVAARLKRSVKHVYRLIRSGRMRHIADGERSVRISEEHLKSFMQENECASISGRKTARGGANTTTPAADELGARRDAKTSERPNSRREALSDLPTIRIVQPRTKPRTPSTSRFAGSSRTDAQK